MKINPEFKAKWVEALRSGKYTQGTSLLKQYSNKDQVVHCCLGVACEVAGIPSKVTKNRPIVFIFEDGTPQGEIYELPLDFAEKMGLEGKNPEVVIKGVRVNLTRCNDGLKMTFEEIADLIESQL